MNPVQIGKDIRTAYDQFSRISANINVGGNLGMAFIAAAISEHAKAVDRLAQGLERFAELPGAEFDPLGEDS